MKDKGKDNSKFKIKSKLKINTFFKTVKDKLSLNNKRKSTMIIIEYLKEHNVNNLLLYTHMNNVLQQVEFGVSPINFFSSDQKDHITWSYLEKDDHLELELDTSTRNAFWKWITDQEINIDEIAVIAFDVNKLFANTSQEWEFNEKNHRVSIFENINNECISWIILKNNFLYSCLNNYIKQNKLNIKLFQTDDGKIISNN